MSDTAEILDKPAPKKPYLGGYRNPSTGQVYHHAQTQTLISPWKYKPVTRFTREAQTAPFTNDSQQTVREAFTQVETEGLYLCTNDDEKVMDPLGQFIPLEVITKNGLDAAILIQKYVRKWFAVVELKRLKKEAAERILWDEERKAWFWREEEQWLRELESRIQNPRTKDDFTLVFSKLQEWWEERVKELKDRESGPKLKASLWALVDEESQKIQQIELQKQTVQKEDQSSKRYTMIDKTAQPKVWKGYKGPVLVENSHTQRAREMQRIYTTLTKPKLVPEDRIAALIQVKETIKNFDCALTNNLISLVNREIDLLQRGTKEKYLMGLRNRIKNLFWQVLRQPVFNPEAKIFSPFNQKELPHIYLCSSCKRYYMLPHNSTAEATTFPLIKQRLSKCNGCLYLQNEGWIRRNLEVYKRMLKLLRIEEEKKLDTSGIIYLMQPRDISFIVDKIWKSQSCISGSSVLKDLELARWNIHKKWMPWNCVLLSKAEAFNHAHCEDNKQLYDTKFRRAVYLKHLEARHYFSMMPRFLPYLSEEFDVEMEKISEEEL